MSLPGMHTCRFPIIQAPMAGAQDSALAIAVSRSGGLGSLPAALLSPEALRQELTAMEKAGVGAVNVNFFAHTMPQISLSQKSAWQQRLASWWQRFGIDPATIGTGMLRQPFGEMQLALVQEFKPAVVSFHFGLPEAALLAAVKATGAAVYSSATTLKEALWLADHGADVVIAQGVEAGGHRAMFLETDVRTQVGTLALVRQISAALKPRGIGVVAAGGIGDAESIRAVLALGADAVQIGTAFLLCDESRIGAQHRQALRHAVSHPESLQTALTNVFSGKPARGIVNELMRDLDFILAEPMPFPYAGIETAALKAAAEKEGSAACTPLWCGQYPGECAEIPAQELMVRLQAAFL